MRGSLQAVTIAPEVRAFLAVDAAASETAITVTNGFLFDTPDAVADILGQMTSVISVTYGEGEEAVDTLTLANSLTDAVDAGDPVDLVGAPKYTLATVDLDDGTVVHATVDRGQQSEIELQEGTYEEPRPVVEVSFIDGEHYIVGVNGRGATDGSYIDPGTLPDLPTSDGLPPQAAPSIAAFPGSDYVAARLSWVDNPDELHSRVYASTTPEPDLAGPEVGTVANGGVLVVREFGDGTELPQDVDLWLQAIPFDGDGDGPVSDVVGPVRLAKVTRTQIGEHEIETRHLAADAITADLLVTNRALAEALEVEDLDGVNIRGVNVEAGKFTGGAIAIAQGVAAARSTGFDSTSGKTPPSGWSLARFSSLSGGDTAGVFFDTTGGVAGGAMRTVAREWTADDFNLYTWESLYLTTAEATDTRITFDYRTTRSGRPWRTYDMRPQDAWGQTRLVFRLGNAMGGQPVPQTLIVDLTNCAPIAYSGSEQVGNYYPPFSGPADRWPAANTWHSCELIYRGAVLSVRQGPRGGQMGAWQHYTVPLNIRPGHVVLEQLHGDVPDSGQIHGSGRTGTAAIVNAGTMRFDNLAVETLAGGLAVEPTGATHVPLVPTVDTHAASKRYVDSRLPDTGWISIPLASGYTTLLGQTPQYRLRHGQVKVRGLIGRTGGAAFAANNPYTVWSNMPGGIRPSQDEWYTTTITGNNSGSVRVQADGSLVVAPLVNATSISLAIAPWLPAST